MLIPVGAKDFKATNLRGATHMLPNAGTDIIVTNAHQSYHLRRVIGQPVEAHLIRDMVAVNKLKSDGHVLIDQLVHAPLYLSFGFSVWFRVKDICDLALLALDVRIVRPGTAKHTYHRLVEQMFRRVRRGK